MGFICLAIGVLIGVVGTVMIFRRHSVGTLRVDNSDPYEPPALFLELSKGVDTIVGKKYVVAKVCVKDYISQK